MVRLSETTEARLTLWTQRVGGRPASNLVFLLKNVVVGRKPVATIQHSGTTYEPSTITVSQPASRSVGSGVAPPARACISQYCACPLHLHASQAGREGGREEVHTSDTPVTSA